MGKGGEENVPCSDHNNERGGNGSEGRRVRFDQRKWRDYIGIGVVPKTMDLSWLSQQPEPPTFFMCI